MRKESGLKKASLLSMAALLILTMCLFTGCSGGGSGTTAVMTNDNGEAVELSAKELVEVDDSNDVKYKKEYLLKEVTVTGKVKEINENVRYNGILMDGYIKLEDNWEIDFQHTESTWYDHIDVISELEVGDTVEVVGELNYTKETNAVVFGVKSFKKL